MVQKADKLISIDPVPFQPAVQAQQATLTASIVKAQADRGAAAGARKQRGLLRHCLNQRARCLRLQNARQGEA